MSCIEREQRDTIHIAKYNYGEEASTPYRVLKMLEWTLTSPVHAILVGVCFRQG